MRRTRTLASLAVLLTALALVPAGAHFFALPNKLAMPADTYLAAQRAYDGWALLGVLSVAAILANLDLALRLRRRGRPAGMAWLAALLLLSGLAIFFAWAFPANQATANWTTLPPDWPTLRTAWEWSHAANALLSFAALCASLRAASRSGAPS
jgi:hypothetical protein